MRFDSHNILDILFWHPWTLRWPSRWQQKNHLPTTAGWARAQPPVPLRWPWPRGPTALRALGLRSAGPAARRPRHQPHMSWLHGNSASKLLGTAALAAGPGGQAGGRAHRAGAQVGRGGRQPFQRKLCLKTMLKTMFIFSKAEAPCLSGATVSNSDPRFRTPTDRSI